MARGTTLSRPDLQSVTSAYRDEVGYIVEEGNAGLINVTPSIMGKYRNVSDSDVFKGLPIAVETALTVTNPVLSGIIGIGAVVANMLR